MSHPSVAPVNGSSQLPLLGIDYGIPTTLPSQNTLAPSTALSMPMDYMLPTFIDPIPSFTVAAPSLNSDMMPIVDGTILSPDEAIMQTLDPQLSFTELESFEAWLHDLSEIKDAIGSQAQVCCFCCLS